MGKLFCRSLDHPSQVFACKACGTHLCDVRNVVSKQFHGRKGRAILVQGVINVYFMHAEERMLMTGLHIVRDVHCVSCRENVGWTYDYAQEERERYKIQRFVLERELLDVITQYSIDEQFQPPRAPGADDSFARGAV